MIDEREIAMAQDQEARELCQQAKTCPNCNQNGITGKGIKTTRHEVTDYGVKFVAPFNKCNGCGFEYTDYEYEEAEERALVAARGRWPRR